MGRPVTEAIQGHLDTGGWSSLIEPGAARELADEVIEEAGPHAEGTILERRGDDIEIRQQRPRPGNASGATKRVPGVIPRSASTASWSCASRSASGLTTTKASRSIQRAYPLRSWLPTSPTANWTATCGICDGARRDGGA